MKTITILVKRYSDPDLLYAWSYYATTEAGYRVASGWGSSLGQVCADAARNLSYCKAKLSWIIEK